MADEEGGDLVDLPAYVEDDTETAAAKADWAKRRAEGMWGMHKILLGFLHAVVGVEALAFAFAGLGWVMVARFVVWIGCTGSVVVWDELDENMGTVRKVDDGGCLGSDSWVERVVDMVAGAMGWHFCRCWLMAWCEWYLLPEPDFDKLSKGGLRSNSPTERIKVEHDKYPVIPARHVDRQVESSAGAMRHLPVTLSGPQLALSANIISIKLVESAIGFPLDVYGTIVVRDELDCKRIYLFQHQDNCQRISSMDESLSLTGPSRGLVAFKNLYFEIDLKCKNHLAVKERVLCNWFVKDSTLTNTSNVVRNRFVGKICTLDLAYAPAHRAVEVAIKVKIHDILRTEYTEFHGKVTACINGIPEEVVIYDSKAAGCVIKVGDDGLLELLRCVVSVPIDKMVSFKLVSHDGHFVLDSYPRMWGGFVPSGRLRNAGRIELAGAGKEQAGHLKRAPSLRPIG
ncbi:hypothetical protein PR202_ga05612 [Eleusine coracana subsp. coracana]|uniref:DUF6598 domain-containing protein n=1 Tax=Eleusine coracana subsp. coracana TaxID=191504 RepID=A0AAV5BSZ8_ELECO|nr:hypothetical protein PR202_ga05158 [Eleusine coracana subsp. coracana]GJM89418.1 hypothetical protein PR202_ga05612 [Eleusine coracana subsp. coracana]